MRVLYDAEGDALYIPLKGRGAKVDQSVAVDDSRVVDLDSDGHAVGIEVIGASQGFAVEDLIERFGLEGVRNDLVSIEKHRFQPIQYAPPAG